MADIKRLQYHDGQLLDVSDFNDEQDYHREMRKRHNRSVHSCGIVEGLAVKKTGTKITISPGTAVDKDGQELILLQEETSNSADLKSATRYVTAKFEGVDDDTMEEKDKDGKKMYSRRTIERPKIEVTDKEPAKDGSVIVLAKLNWDGEGKITVDQSARSPSVSSRIDPAADLIVGRLSLARTNDKRGALFLAELNPSFGHALYNNAFNIDDEGGWDGVKWNVGYGLNIRTDNRTDSAVKDKRISALFINNNRNVGIGTTDPRSTLSVKGGLAVGTNYAGTNAAPDNGLLVEGKVGIGATGPDEKLQVNAGNIRLDGGQKILFTDTGTTNNLKLQLWTGYGLGINGSTLFYAANGKHSWRNNNGTDERMALSTAADGGLTVTGTGTSSFAGKLGIGKPDPGAKLEVAVADNDASTKPLAVGKGTTNYLTMLNNGNVGIGKADPGAKLEVAGTLTATANDETLVGLKIAPTFAEDGKTGVKRCGLDLAGKGDKAGQVSLQLRSGNSSVKTDSTQITLGYNDTAQYRHAVKSRHNGSARSGNAIDFYVWKYLSATDKDTPDTIGSLHTMTLDGGNVGIGTTDPGDLKLKVEGNAHITGTLWASTLVHYWGPGGLGWVSLDNRGGNIAGHSLAAGPSDLRFKADLRPIRNALEKVLQLHGVCYRWGETGLKFFTREIPNRLSAGPDATEEENQQLWAAERRKAYEALAGEKIGLVAQDVEAVVPEVVHEDEEGYKYIQYQQLTALLVEAIKEHNELIQSLSIKVAALEPA